MTVTPNKQKTLLVMAGGTGGHIFPGIAVADFLAGQGWAVHWLGTAEKMEAKIVPAHGYAISFINISGLRGKSLVNLIKAPFKIMQSVLQARRVLKTIKPDVVLGMGGYASAPGGIASWLTKTPLIIHEQNAVAGLSNRLLARLANKVLAAFPRAFTGREVDVVGNPLRGNICSVASKPQLDDISAESKEKNILIVGGSLGAKVLNDTVPQAIKLILAEQEVKVWHQSGGGHLTEVEKNYTNAGLTKDESKITEFIDDMSSAYTWADIVVCRAGALTVSELSIAGKPAIYVPLPHAVDDHQTKNALYLVEKGAGILLPQAQLNAESLAEKISSLLRSNEKIEQMSKAASAAAYVDATEVVAKHCIALAK